MTILYIYMYIYIFIYIGRKARYVVNMVLAHVSTHPSTNQSIRWSIDRSSDQSISKPINSTIHHHLLIVARTRSVIHTWNLKNENGYYFHKPRVCHVLFFYILQKCSVQKRATRWYFRLQSGLTTMFDFFPLLLTFICRRPKAKWAEAVGVEYHLPRKSNIWPRR